MKLCNIQHDCYYFHAAVNIGYVKAGDQGLLIDAGLDKSTIKKVIKELDKEQLPLTHLFITHAHADHFGGAAHLQKTKDVFTMAPPIEEAILRYPILEPIYLFQGNHPLPEMRNKFLEGEAIRVDQVLNEGNHEIGAFTFECISFPGHSENQMGIKINEILYCGDAYFSLEQLQKHKIPYIVDCQHTINTLEKCLTIDCYGVVPGHGEFETAYQRTIRGNIVYHHQILDWMSDYFKLKEAGVSHEELVRDACEAWEISLPFVSSWMLYRTAITAYATKLVKDDLVELSIKDFALSFNWKS
ncbi:MBL fold metallo-hydrolase [Cytobacillus sp. IB215665]|uniref:MBL fold metallo-hydrolase n=1 Tax=Cytobacillus sp. IB215665 TaxID=3097357 RepID=UPI002A14DEF8|nr:MBL fold metallo-hydrolase [Cytobacillus sp. IB215665]MDX8366676.1 MBL fold metallo-hydrolase [Cytobacillus sp. IB215665]